jgi:hypothetical protein
MRCGIVEEPEDELVRFCSGLRREIQDIVDYKEFTTVNQLFQFAMLAEKELQGRHSQEKTGGRTSFAPRTQAHSGLPKSSSLRASTPLAKKTTSGVAPTPNKTPHVLQIQVKVFRRHQLRVLHLSPRRDTLQAFSVTVFMVLAM